MRSPTKPISLRRTLLAAMTLGASALLLLACMDSPSGPAPNAVSLQASGADIPGSPSPGRILIIGLDGARSEGIDLAGATHLNALRASGVTDLDAITNDVSLSGPGWSSMLSGVWCDKHKVLDNDVTWANSKFDQYPHFFRRAKTAAPSLNLVSISHWPPINTEILCAAENGGDCGSVATVITKATDLEVKQAAIDTLRNGDPNALFLQFDDIDHAGHGGGTDPGGFCPKASGQIDGQCTARGMNANYLEEIRRIDGYIGEVMSALRARPNFNAENWLVLVSPDHGGGGTVFNQHGFPVAQDRRTFFIASGPAAAALPGRPATRVADLPDSASNGLPVSVVQGVKIVDVAATALFHLGIAIKAAWGLDGQPAGVSGAPAYREKPVPTCYSSGSFTGDTRQ